jgi:hypothetical protein
MNDFWQENKRLVTLVGCGLCVFLIGLLVINSLYGSEVSAMDANVRKVRSELAKARYSASARADAAAANEALRASLGALETRIEFQPRPEFVLPPGCTAGEASSAYFAAVERVRESLGVLAGRKRISLPQGLELEPVMTMSVDTYDRYLAALDLLDRALRLAFEHNVKQIKRIRVDLDPTFKERKGMGTIEETTIEIKAASAPETITAWLQATQTAAFGQVLPIRDIEAQTRRAKVDELDVSVTFSAIRLHLPDALAEGELD